MPTGSHYICNPPVTYTDIDVLVLARNSVLFHDLLVLNGWRPDEEEHAGNTVRSFRHPDSPINLIVTYSATTYRKWKVATRLAKMYNMRAKAERVAIFQMMIRPLTVTPVILAANYPDHVIQQFAIVRNNVITDEGSTFT